MIVSSVHPKETSWFKSLFVWSVKTVLAKSGCVVNLSWCEPHIRWWWWKKENFHGQKIHWVGMACIPHLWTKPGKWIGKKTCQPWMIRWNDSWRSTSNFHKPWLMNLGLTWLVWKGVRSNVASAQSFLCKLPEFPGTTEECITEGNPGDVQADG